VLLPRSDSINTLKRKRLARRPERVTSLAERQDRMLSREYVPLVSQGERGERRRVFARGVPPVERGRGVKGRATKCRRPWDYRRSYSGYHNRNPTRVLRRPSRVATQQVRRRAKWDFLRVRERRPSDENASLRLQPRRVFRALFSPFFPPSEERIPKPVPPIFSLPTAFSVIYFSNEES
jgi:hypothetical protein